MKKLALAAVLVLVLSGTAHALPDFINGGFEDNNFNGWATSGQTSITNAGFDPRTNNALATVGDGNHSARVGDQDAWGFTGDQYSSVRQTETVGAADLQNLYFAWAAVGLVPTNDFPHDNDETPYFRVELNWYHQGGGMTVLHSEDHYTGNIGAINPGWVQGATHDPSLGENNDGIWYYRPWEVFSFNLANEGILQGDQLEAILTTRDCDPSGHASYAYLDGFGNTPPPIPVVPEPSTMALLGLGVAGVIAGSLRGRRKK